MQNANYKEYDNKGYCQKKQIQTFFSQHLR